MNVRFYDHHVPPDKRKIMATWTNVTSPPLRDDYVKIGRAVWEVRRVVWEIGGIGAQVYCVPVPVEFIP